MMLNDTDSWAPVPGFINYEANRLGEIRNVNTGELMKPFARRRSKSLYLRLYKTVGTATERSVASIVWAAFYKRWPTDSYVCHADGDVRNNAIDNLFLGSRSDVAKTRRRMDDTIWNRMIEEGELVHG